ncbi:MAG: hypothetical protein DRO40_09740 [Thermoprotei archaeon]|nr:MAG: hypothetical protein DRO40_09740 [Thermoprotei archaeon]
MVGRLLKYKLTAFKEKAKYKIIQLFDDFLSYIHFIGGIAYGLSCYYVFIFDFYKWMAILLYLAYIMYEVFTSRSDSELLGDIIEFTFGFITGFIPAFTLGLVGGYE